MDVNIGDPGSLFQSQPYDISQMPQMAARGGMFGGGNGKMALLAALAGFMARRNPSVANNLFNGLQDQQTLKQRYDLMQLQRQQDTQDKRGEFTFERDYEAAHPVPGEQERMIQRYLDPTTSPAEKAIIGSAIQHPVAMDVTNPDGSVTRQYVYPGTIPQPTAPRVFKSLPPDATPIGGGPTPQASGGFPY